MTHSVSQLRKFIAKLACSIALVTLLLAPLAGCVRVSEQGDGDKKKVDVSTPFGDVKVRTDAEAKDTGLPVYPGATLKPKEDKNSNNANVNLSFGDFGLKVVALTYESKDAPDKVLAFYRDKMKTYGTILECKGGSGNITMHKKDKDSDELTCDNDDKGSRDSVELKVGTEGHQRVVAVKPSGGGSEFSLVFVHTRGKEGTL